MIKTMFFFNILITYHLVIHWSAKEMDVKPFWDQFTIVNSDASITATDAAHLCLHHREILTAQGPFREKLKQMTLSSWSSNDPHILMGIHIIWESD